MSAENVSPPRDFLDRSKGRIGTPTCGRIHYDPKFAIWTSCQPTATSLHARVAGVVPADRVTDWGRTTNGCGGGPQLFSIPLDTGIGDLKVSMNS